MTEVKLKNDFQITPVSREDSRRILEIRNQPAARRYSNDSEEISFENHQSWFQKKYFGDGCLNHCLILRLRSGEAIGYCRFDRCSESSRDYTISIALDEKYHHQGVGSWFLKEVLEKFAPPGEIFAEIDKRNITSVKLFQKNNFQSHQKSSEKYHLKYRNDKKNYSNPVFQGNILKEKKVFIFQARRWGRSVGHFLAKKLTAEGCQLGALTFKKGTHNFLLKQTEVNYQSIIFHDEIVADPKAYLKGKRYSLKEICDDLEIDSIWPLVSTLRGHVKCYRDKYYYSFRQNLSDREIIDYIQACYKLLKEVFDDFRPDVILSANFVILPYLMFNLYGKKKGVEMLAVTDSKISGVNIFTTSYQCDQGPFYNRVDELNQGLAETKNRARAKNYIAEFRKSFKEPKTAVILEESQTLKKKIRHWLSPYYHIYRWYLKPPKEIRKNLGPTIDYRPPRIILRDHYCHDFYQRFMKKYRYYPFENLGKFVYFPLQVQPEEVIDVMAPYFTNQIEIARLVAMSLPGDYTLAVKEHPAMVGMRPPSYIKKIARTPNVKLIDYRIPSEKVLQKTSLVVSPSSTTLVEAAFYNKPAIQLGDMGTPLKMPNIFKHTDLTTISRKIKELLDLNLETDEYQRELENYVAAAYDTGFELNYWQIWERGKRDKMDLLWEAWREEIKRALITKENHQV